MAAAHPAISGRPADAAPWRCAEALGASFLCGAGGRPPAPGTRIFQPFDAPAFLADAERGFDAASLTQHDPDMLRALAGLLHRLAPDLVHLHDLAPFGVELVSLLRRERPAARILLSLTPELMQRLGMLGGSGDASWDFLHTTLMRRFLTEADAILLPCASLLAPCRAFGLNPARLHLRAAWPPEPPPPVPRNPRWVIAAAFATIPAEAARIAHAAALIAAEPPRGPRALRLELHGPARDAASPLVLVPPGGERLPHLAAADLAVLPEADGEGIAAEARAARCPVLRAATAPELAAQLLDLAEHPERLAALRAAQPAPPSQAEAARAWLGFYRGFLGG